MHCVVSMQNPEICLHERATKTHFVKGVSRCGCACAAAAMLCRVVDVQVAFLIRSWFNLPAANLNVGF